ncbi:MAG: hypothetical protein JXA87_13780 [Thermoleophilia bacterium]|nr:hypothetical protein [Thermoleophilia bacterium]
MSFWDKAWNWNATEEEWRGSYPCDKYIQGPQQAFIRAVDVQAPAEILFRWVCQIKVAPYSYDLIDNWFRRSPQQFTPGAEKLEAGQEFLVGPIVEFEQDRHITVVFRSDQERGCPPFSLTYEVKPTGLDSSRLVCKADLTSRGRRDRVRWFLLAWGDLIMMRKQFLTLKKLAERTAREATGTGPAAVDAKGGAA